MKILTTMIKHSDTKKPGSIPGITSSSWIDIVCRYPAIPHLSHIITVAAPEIIPTIAPHFVVRLHHSDSIINGPNDAASPPQAKATRK